MKRKKNEIHGIRKGGNRLHAKRTGALVLTLALVLGIFAAPEIPGMTNPAGVRVEAKSGTDKKKPTIKFSGKSQITVEKNEVIKIPKTTAKDNKDGNVTKKISVTVKKGKTNYKSIATKIKKNKKVKFSSAGKYTVTYSVKDKAGNKATKKRYITVVEQKTNTTTETQTTEIPTTTEAPTTTEQPATEVPKKPTTGIYQETINGITYNITRDITYSDMIGYAPQQSDKINIEIQNDYEVLYMDFNDGFHKTSQYISFLGSIKATDQDNNDISDRILIYEYVLENIIDNTDSCNVYIYVKDGKGNSLKKYINFQFRDFKECFYDDLDELDLLNENPLVYGKRRVKTEQ